LDKLGKYELLDLLGEGGMGMVYRARDTAIGRIVALKVMHSRVADTPSIRDRFLREARAAGMLQHPNVVVIFDLGEENGVPYIAMEQLRGRAFDRLLDANTLDLTQKLRIFLQVCDGLDYAHRNGVIHRDIKPANVIVLDEDGTAKILDFGIARVQDASRLTMSGMVMGTVAYMAPEQLRNREVDARADIFSAGVMLYEALAGRLPFEGDSTAATMMMILEDDAPPLQPFGIVRPEPLDRIVRKALEKDPDQRYQTAADLRHDVLSYYQHMGEPTAPHSSAPSQPGAASQGTVASRRPAPRHPSSAGNVPPRRASASLSKPPVAADRRLVGLSALVVLAIAFAGLWYSGVFRSFWPHPVPTPTPSPTPAPTLAQRPSLSVPNPAPTAIPLRAFYTGYVYTVFVGPVPGVTVALFRRDSKGELVPLEQAMTDAKGNFSLGTTSNKVNAIRFSRNGYETLTCPVTTSSPRTHHMNSQPFNRGTLVRDLSKNVFAWMVCGAFRD